MPGSNWQQALTTVSVCHDLASMFQKSDISEESAESIDAVIITDPTNEVNVVEVRDDTFSKQLGISDLTADLCSGEFELNFNSFQRRIKSVPPPLNLDGPIDVDLVPDPVYDRLTELAIIATSPQSPLLQSSPTLPRKRSFSLSSLHSYARAPKSSSSKIGPKLPISQRNTYHFGEDIFQRIEMTPEDTSAAYTLSTMAQQQKFGELKKCIYPTKHRIKARNTEIELTKPKRPMNGFMLFARKFRVLYSQKFPGKDNRAISVLLGDHWKKLKIEERDAYAQEAKVLADKTKMLHPDCWKRKRSFSTSS